MEILLTKALATFALPPGINLLLAFTGVILLFRHRTAGVVVLLLALGSLYALSTSLVANALSAKLESVSPYPLRAPAASEAGAIVVLGGGRTAYAPEYGGETVSPPGLERLRYAARLHARTGLPILVTGGGSLGESRDEASMMKRVLVEDFKVPVRWTETRSRTTHENALYSARLLEAEGIGTVLLVSHASHLRRAAASFRRQGIEVVPAPTAYRKSGSPSAGLLALLPSAGALSQSSSVFHEYLGALWYRFRHA